MNITLLTIVIEHIKAYNPTITEQQLKIAERDLKDSVSAMETLLLHMAKKYCQEKGYL